MNNSNFLNIKLDKEQESDIRRNSSKRTVVFMYRNIQSQLVSRRLKKISNGLSKMVQKESIQNIKSTTLTPIPIRNEPSSDCYNFIRTGSRIK